MPGEAPLLWVRWVSADMGAWAWFLLGMCKEG